MSMEMTYAKLCKNAEEIQERWKPKSGDKYHNKVAINPLRPSMIGSDVMDGIIEYDQFNNKDLFWLPRAEDYIKILMETTGLKESEIIEDIANDLVCCFIGEGATLDALLLELTMEKCFNKQVGKDNTWEEIE